MRTSAALNTRLIPALLATALAAALIPAMVPSTARAQQSEVSPRVPSAVPVASPGFNGLVTSIANRGPVVYVGGDFNRATDATGTYVRRNAAAFDARTGRLLPWNPRANGRVSDILVSRTTVYIGGGFTRVKGKPRSRVALVSAGGSAKLLGFRHDFGRGVVRALAGYRGRIYVGGTFTSVDRQPRGELAAFTRAGRLTSWRPMARKGSVNDLVATASGVYVGGHFRHINKVKSSIRLALVSRRSGAVVGSFAAPVDKPVLSLAADGSRVYAGVGGSGGGYAAAYSRANGSQVWLRRFDGDVAAVALHASELLVGGHFHEACDVDQVDPHDGHCLAGSQAREHLAALSLSGSVLTWNPGTDSVLGVVVIDSLQRYGAAAGGDFTTAAGVVRHRMAVFD